MNATKVIAWFEGGIARACDISHVGLDDGQVDQFDISYEGDSIAWANGAKVSVDELLERSEVVDVVQDEKQRLLQELSAIRREAAFSQTRLGDAAGIRQSVISRIEGCEISPQINTLLKLLAPLGKTLAIVDLIEE